MTQPRSPGFDNAARNREDGLFSGLFRLIPRARRPVVGQFDVEAAEPFRSYRDAAIWSVS